MRGMAAFRPRRRSTPPMPFSNVDTEFFAFGGGLDQVSAPIALPPGACIDSLNYEGAVQGGYRRIAGFERCDGRPAPSAAVYYVIACNFSGAVAAGNSILGAASGATAVVLFVNANSLVYTKLVGAFQNGEQIKVAGVVVATATGIGIPNGGATAALQLQYQSLAAAQYRADIQALPGEGRVLGVWVYNGKRYGFRNNVGSTAAAMFVESAAGWVQINIGLELKFQTGSGAIADGDIVTGATSGATGTVKRFCLQSGAMTGAGKGKLVFQAVAGNFVNGENLQVAGVTKAVSIGTQVAVTLQPNGRFDFWNFAFSGAGDAYRMYGCDGVSRGFEFDDNGNVFVAIDTGMTKDTPNFVSEHLNYLVFNFGPSVQLSSLGMPYQWTPITGANELTLGENCTGLLQQTGDDITGALFILGRRTVKALYGTNPATFELRTISPDIGAVAYTVQNMLLPVYLNDAGVVRADRVQSYGHFEMATISRSVNPFITSKRGLATASAVVPSMNIYRLFFSDGTALALTFGPPAPYTVGPTVLGMMPLNLGKPVRCACSGKDTSGVEMTLFGSDDGYVYQMDKGTSFDGAAITAYVRLAFNHSKSPRMRKRYRKAVFECDMPAGASVSVQQRVYDGDSDFLKALSVQSANSAALWDSAIWDTSIWSDGLTTTVEPDLAGEGTRVSLLLYSNSALQGSDTFFGEMLHYSPGRLQR